MYMRIDKLLCELNLGTRSQIKEQIRKGQVSVNGKIQKDPGTKVDEKNDVILLNGKRILYKPYAYYLLHKPKGCITATRDPKEQTVMDVFCNSIRSKQEGELSGIPIRDLFPVGRLDKDTTGLLLITNDGELAHKLLSPAHHVEKTYFVCVDKELTEEAVKKLTEGVDIGEKKRTRPARIEVQNEKNCLITITEGKYHQIKRMMEAVNNRILTLERLTFGPLTLDPASERGAWRELTGAEIRALQTGDPTISITTERTESNEYQ